MPGIRMASDGGAVEAGPAAWAGWAGSAGAAAGGAAI
jgi:hypothetical protein